MAETTKRCGGCKTEKPLSAFSKNRKTKDGVQYRCKLCTSMAARKRYAEKKAEQQAKSPTAAITKREKHRKEALTRTVKRCSKCGETKPLNEFPRAKDKLDGLSSRCLVCARVACRKSYATYRDAHAEQWQQYYAENRNTLLERRREQRKRDPAPARQATKRWRDRNPEKTCQAATLRRARLAAAPVIETVERAVVFQRDNGCCYLCQRSIDLRDMHLDHVVPLSRGGTHTYDNVKAACVTCNLRKGRKLLSELDLEHVTA